MPLAQRRVALAPRRHLPVGATARAAGTRCSATCSRAPFPHFGRRLSCSATSPRAPFPNRRRKLTLSLVQVLAAPLPNRRRLVPATATKRLICGGSAGGGRQAALRLGTRQRQPRQRQPPPAGAQQPTTLSSSSSFCSCKTGAARQACRAESVRLCARPLRAYAGSSQEGGSAGSFF